MSNINLSRKLRRKLRISKNLFGTAKRPRVTVFRSNKYIYAQAIDDEGRKTLASFSSLKFKVSKEKSKKTEVAQKVGKELAKLLIDKKIKEAIFDRGSYAYNGRVKALAEGIREGGVTI